MRKLNEKITFESCRDQKIVIDKFMLQMHIMYNTKCTCLSRNLEIEINPDDRLILAKMI